MGVGRRRCSGRCETSISSCAGVEKLPTDRVRDLLAVELVRPHDRNQDSTRLMTFA
jgi:hypothetical protein